MKKIRLKKLRIYLDTCVYNRPFDDKDNPRITLEAEVFLILLKEIERGRYALVVSTVNVMENEKNPHYERKEKIKDIFSLADDFIELDKKDLARAENLEKLGFTGLDALHIAVCEKAKVDYFITCDDKLIKAYIKNRRKIKIKVINVLDFVREEVLKWH